MDAATRPPRLRLARVDPTARRDTRSLSDKLREITERSPQDGHALEVLADLVLARLNASANVAS
jgi:hypothetical protein